MNGWCGIPRIPCRDWWYTATWYFWKVVPHHTKTYYPHTKLGTNWCSKCGRWV